MRARTTHTARQRPRLRARTRPVLAIQVRMSMVVLMRRRFAPPATAMFLTMLLAKLFLLLIQITNSTLCNGPRVLQTLRCERGSP